MAVSPMANGDGRTGCVGGVGVCWCAGVWLPAQQTNEFYETTMANMEKQDRAPRSFSCVGAWVRRVRGARTPIVDFDSKLNSFLVNLESRFDLPTPESPIKTAAPMNEAAPARVSAPHERAAAEAHPA